MGIAAFVALVGFSRSFEKEWMRLFESEGTDLAVYQKTFVNTTVDGSVADQLRAFPGIAAVAPVIVNLMDLTPDVNAIVYGWPDNSFEMDPLVMLQGRRFHGDAPEIMLGEILAGNLEKKAGDHLEIQGESFLVTGVFRGGSVLVTGAAVLPIRQLQRLSDLGNKVSGFSVKLVPSANGESTQELVPKMSAKIEAAFPGLKAVPASERAQNNQLVTLARSTAWGTSLIALFIGALSIANTMAMSVFERTKEIGVLRALGWKRWRIMRLILIEAGILGLVGGILGLLGGLGGLRILATLPATASLASASIPWTHAAEAMAISVFIGLAAGFMPAYRGARLSPVEALRYE